MALSIRGDLAVTCRGNLTERCLAQPWRRVRVHDRYHAHATDEKTCRCSVSSPERDVAAHVTNAEVQRQLTEAASCGDIETCLYLINHERYKNMVEIPKTAMTSIVSTCFKRKQPEKALRLVLASKEPKQRDFSLLMKECIKRKDIYTFEKVVASRIESGYPEDAYTWSARITVLGAVAGGGHNGDGGHSGDCGHSGGGVHSGEIMKAFEEGIQMESCRKIEVYNAAIHACVVCGDWAGAWYVWEKIQESQGQVVPDIVTYNSMVKAAGVAGRMDDVKLFYDKIYEDGIKPTERTFTAVFSSAACCQFGDALWLCEVYDGMMLQPNDYILSSFLSAMSFAHCTRHDIDKIFEIIEDARRIRPLNDVTYTALLMFLSRQDMPERAVDVWNAARQDEINLSPHFFSALFTTCGKGSVAASASLYNVAMEAFDELNVWWLKYDPRTVAAQVEKNALTAYNAFLHYLGVQNQVDLASLVFESMNDRGPLPDVVSYNTMLHILGESKEVDAALTLFWQMSASGLEPTERTFGSLLHVFASVGDSAAAEQVFGNLESHGILPNTVMYTSFINAAVRNGNEESLRLAFIVAEDMQAKGIPLTDVTYGCLLVACEKMGDVSKAFLLYQQACGSGIKPSDEMHNILISVCARCGRIEDALELVKSMARRHSTLQQHAMNSLTRALSVESPIRALRMLSLMQTMRLQPTRRTRLTVLKELSKAGDVIEALEIYNSLSTYDMEVDGPSGSALISSLCQAQNLDDAVRVYDQMMSNAWRVSNGTGKYSLRKRALVPNGDALASLAQGHAAAGLLSQAWKYYAQLRRHSYSLQKATSSHRRLFEALIEGNCRQNNLKRALIVFDDWKAASALWTTTNKKNTSPLKSISEDDESTLHFVQSKEHGAAQRNASADHDGHSLLNHYQGNADHHQGNANYHQRNATQHAVTEHQHALKEQQQRRTKTPKLSNVALAYLEASCNNDPNQRWRVYDVLAVMRSQKESKRQSQLARPEKPSHHFSS